MKSSNDEVWRLSHAFKEKRQTRRRSSAHVASGSSVDMIKGTSTPIRGIIRGPLRSVRHWKDLCECIMRFLKDELVRQGVQEPQLSRMENNAASFGAADVVSEKVVNRWVMDFTPCVASDADLMSAWSSVKRGIEEVMLPDLNTMMVSGKGLSKHKKTFEDQTLRLDDDYTCIRQCVMVDPVGSSLQKSHVDISNSLLTKFIGSFNVWNVFIPVQVEPGHPETAVHHNSPPSQPLPNVNVGWDDVYFFDGMKTHYGRGNLHNKPRVLIHVVYVQTKLLQHPLGREEISQQFQKNGLFAHPEERNIFDRRTLVGSSGVADKLLELKIKRTVWEKNGGLSSDVSLSKKDNWNRYKPDKKRTRSSSKLR